LGIGGIIMGLFDKIEESIMIDYGNGILYFDVSRVDFSDFAKELSIYLKDHCDKRVVKMMPDSYANYPCGYIVIVEKV
jgi:hypothetical protein